MSESFSPNEPIVEFELEQASFEVSSSHSQLSNVWNIFRDDLTSSEDAVDVDCHSCLQLPALEYTHSVMHPVS